MTVVRDELTRLLYREGRVKYKSFLIAWVALWMVGLGCIVAGFHGDLNVGFGSSLQSNTFRLCGTTTGWFAVVGLLSILGGVAMLVAALVSLASEKMRT